MLTKQEIKIKNLIGSLGCITKKQLYLLANLQSGVEKRLPEKMIQKKVLRKEILSSGEEIYCLFYQENFDIDTLKCIEVLNIFKEHISWYSLGTYPFNMILSMNNKIFDVVCINNGEESIKSNLLKRVLISNSENENQEQEQSQSLIIIVESQKNIEKINLRSENIVFFDMLNKEFIPNILKK